MTIVLLLHFLFLDRVRESRSIKQKLSKPGCKLRFVYHGHYHEDFQHLLKWFSCTHVADIFQPQEKMQNFSQTA